MHVRLNEHQLHRFPKCQRPLGLIVRIPRRNRPVPRIRHCRHKPLLRRLLRQRQPQLGLILHRRLAIRRVVNLQDNIRPRRHQLRRMIDIEPLRLHPRRIRRQQFVTDIHRSRQWIPRRRLPVLILRRRHIRNQRFGLLHPLRTRRPHHCNNVMHHGPVARPQLRRRHPSVANESRRDHQIHIRQRPRSRNFVSLRHLKNFVRPDIPPLAPRHRRRAGLSHLLPAHPHPPKRQSDSDPPCSAAGPP